jgi:hypothetical protein
MLRHFTASGNIGIKVSLFPLHRPLPAEFGQAMQKGLKAFDIKLSSLSWRISSF